jgi:hypothetical protein
MKLTEVDKLYIALSELKLGTIKGEYLARVQAATVLAQQRDANIAAAAALKLETDAVRENADAWVKKIEEMQKADDASLKAIESAADLVNNLEEENRLLTLSNVEREKAIALRRLEATGIDQSSSSFKGLVARMNDAVETQEKLKEQIGIWQDIDNAAHDAFTHIFETGRSVFQRLLDSLKQIGLELAYMAAKKWAISIVASVGSGAASAAGGGIGGLGGLFGGIGGLFGDATAGLQTFAGNAALSLGASGELATLIAANALPIVGTVIAVGGALIYNWLKSKEGGPKTGGFATSGLIGTLGGSTDSTGRFVTPTDSDAQIRAYTDAILKSYDDFAKALGIKSIAGFVQGFTSDPQGDAGNILHTQAFVNGKSVYDVALGDLGRDAQELEQAGADRGVAGF